MEIFVLSIHDSNEVCLCVYLDVFSAGDKTKGLDCNEFWYVSAILKYLQCFYFFKFFISNVFTLKNKKVDISQKQLYRFLFKKIIFILFNMINKMKLQFFILYIY